MNRTFPLISSGFTITQRDQSLARKLAVAGAAAMLLLVLAPLSIAQRTKVKPGWNLFSTQQDIEIGKEVSQQAEQQLSLLNDSKVDSYLNRLGQKLASKAPGEKYPYQFKGVNDASINAFALPGGFLYINRGTIEAADNEAQLAGVIGHEIAHAALRHGTNQMSKSTAMQLPLAMLGSAVGSNSIAGLLTQVGANFGAQSVLLKYSRDAERQADLVGTQILYDNNYDPRQMAEFFMKLEKESGQSGGRAMEFFSSHPNPQNRITEVNAEVAKMGKRTSIYQNDTVEFREIRKYVGSLPAAPKAQAPGSGKSSGNARQQRPPLPSGRFQDYSNSYLSLRYPDNWKAYGQGDAFTLAPESGFIADGTGNTSLAYGTMMAIFEPHANSSGRIDLESATGQLISSLRGANPNLQVSGNSSRIRVGGQQSLASVLTNASPLGGNETDYLVTVLRPEGLYYFVFVAPEKEYGDYRRTFQDMTASISFIRR
jgi:beta-barrel assembly-enhancing protease